LTAGVRGMKTCLCGRGAGVWAAADGPPWARLAQCSRRVETGKQSRVAADVGHLGPARFPRWHACAGSPHRGGSDTVSRGRDATRGTISKNRDAPGGARVAVGTGARRSIGGEFSSHLRRPLWHDRAGGGFQGAGAARRVESVQPAPQAVELFQQGPPPVQPTRRHVGRRRSASARQLKRATLKRFARSWMPGPTSATCVRTATP
jgi:hypothetical protein